MLLVIELFTIPPALQVSEEYECELDEVEEKLEKVNEFVKITLFLKVLNLRTKLEKHSSGFQLIFWGYG